MLADDFVAGGEGDEMGEALHGDGVAVAHVGGDRFAKGGDFGHWSFCDAGAASVRAAESTLMIHAAVDTLHGTGLASESATFVAEDFFLLGAGIQFWPSGESPAVFTNSKS